MLKSMTAFARCESSDEWGVLVWELRSVNHRYLETSLRMPEELRALDGQIRERVGKRVKRGKLECTLRWKPALDASVSVEVNQELAEALVKACHQMDDFMMNAARISPLDVLKWPGVVKEPEQDMQALLQAVLDLFDQALEELVATREREGKSIKQLLTQRCNSIEELLAAQRENNPQALERVREKLLARLDELDVQPDTSRLEQELVYIAQRLDVDEELDRLATHVTEMRRIVKLKEPVGRRLDFLMQEFNREANTLGSKSTDSVTTQNAIDLKVLIEQMREQIQNLE